MKSRLFRASYREIPVPGRNKFLERVAETYENNDHKGNRDGRGNSMPRGRRNFRDLYGYQGGYVRVPFCRHPGGAV